MGGRPPDTTDREILRLFSESKEYVISTMEVAESLSYSHNGAYKRLKKLAEEGLLGTKKIGDASAWWLTDEGKAFLNGDRDFVSDWESKS